MEISSGDVIFKQATVRGFWGSTVSRTMPAEQRRALFGELVQRNRAMMLGYYKNADETARVLRNGWVQYFSSLNLPQRYPALVRIACAPRVPAWQRDAHEAQMRLQGAAGCGRRRHLRARKATARTPSPSPRWSLSSSRRSSRRWSG